MADRIRRILFIFWQSTYGFLQTFLGMIVFLVNLNRPHFFYRNAIYTVWKNYSGVSLGLFVFIPDLKEPIYRKHVMDHEFGHCVQSAILGPLYLPIIGIPSFSWANLPVSEHYRVRKHVNYEAFYTERWANRLGDTEQW